MRRYHSFRSAFAVILTIAGMLGVCLSASADPKLAPVNSIHVLPDPGPQPTVLDSDYAPYRKAGSAVISGHIGVLLPDGQKDDCSGQQVILYPNTPFTRWLLTTYARKLDGNRMSYGLLFAGDSHSDASVPSYLNPFDRDAFPTTALRFGTCDQANNIVIRNIPKGDYILLTYVQNQVFGVQEKTTQTIVNTPYGEHPEEESGGSMLTRKLGDGYLLATRRELKVDAASNYTLADGNLRPVAHFAP